MAQVSEQDIERIEASIIEMKRLRTLSNEELVREHSKLKIEEDADLYVMEFWCRLWPEWKQYL